MDALGRKYRKHIEQLAVALNVIHALVLSVGKDHGKMSLVCVEGMLSLCVRNDEKTALPVDLMALFD